MLVKTVRVETEVINAYATEQKPNSKRREIASASTTKGEEEEGVIKGEEKGRGCEEDVESRQQRLVE